MIKAILKGTASFATPWLIAIGCTVAFGLKDGEIQENFKELKERRNKARA